MTIQNALASVAVRDLDSASAWYAQVLGCPGEFPMPEVAEWRFQRGGGLQVYALPERAGQGSFTLAVGDLDEVERKLSGMGVDTSKQASSDRVRTLMVTDPDGNHIAFAEAHDPRLAS